MKSSVLEGLRPLFCLMSFFSILMKHALRKKWPYSELFWSAFSRIDFTQWDLCKKYATFNKLWYSSRIFPWHFQEFFQHFCFWEFSRLLPTEPIVASLLLIFEKIIANNWWIPFNQYGIIHFSIIHLRAFA